MSEGQWRDDPVFQEVEPPRKRNNETENIAKAGAVFVFFMAGLVIIMLVAKLFFVLF